MAVIVGTSNRPTVFCTLMQVLIAVLENVQYMTTTFIASQSPAVWASCTRREESFFVRRLDPKAAFETRRGFIASVCSSLST